jgi:RNA polymerase sigma factor (sigma-70 family)
MVKANGMVGGKGEMATKSLGALIGHLHRAALLPDRAGRTDSQLLEYFVSRRDEAAFEALVRRHGPMVFAVCRRVIGNLHDAEDAFQASFLVLARKAASVSPREAVGNWLYGVAYRTARRARAVSARQRAREKQVKDMPHPSTEPADPLQELGPLLDQELSRLPDKYRLPLVLCELEGRPRKEVARQLKLPEGTLSSRLATGRKMLASRLARHGLASSGAMLAALLPQGSASASVPSSLVTSTAKAASLFAAGQAAAAVVSTEVAALVEEVLKTMLLIKLKIGAGLLLSLAALVIGAYGLTSPSLQADPAVVKEPLQVKTEQPPAAVEQGRVQGRFTAADTGKPVAGAEVRVLVQGVSGKAAVVEALSDADGRYTAKVPFGHCRLWGVHSPAGYYTQAPMTYGTIVTTRAEPQMVRDFVLQPGSPWQVDLHGASLPSDKPPLFSAVRDPERQMFSTGETITVTGDARGKAVLTIPAAGGSYRFRCGLMDSSAHYEIPPVNLEIDKGFDPRQIKGVPEPQAQRKAVRLRDTAGRSAVVEGGEVLVEAGRAVLRFHAQRIPTVSALVFRGSAVDEAGKPVKGAKFTAAFATGRGGAMSEWKTMTDARGKMEMADVMLPQSFFEPDGRVRMMVVKPGYDGAQTEELNLLEVKRAGSGDFGTVVLRPGRTLRGKVVDENGRPLQGAIVINMTNYFLYGHLQCRTDAEGRFIMPDLSWGRQQVTAQYGERSGREVFQFDANKGEHLITVRLTPQSGSRQSQSVSRQSSRARPPLPPAPREGVWDLTPPIKEPKYQNEPRYALVVFGPKRDHRVWMVLDGTTLYVDRNGNGDLTEPDERLEPNNPKDGSNHFGGSGSHTHFDVFEFTVRAGIGGTGKFKLHHWIRAENFVPKTDFDRQLHAKWLELRYENSTLWRQDGQGQGQTPVVFMPKPADAQVCALDGPLTFVLKLGENQVLKRGEAGCDLAFHIAVMGRPHRGAEQQFYNPLATTEVPEGAHLVADIEYSSKAANTPPLHRKYLLKQRC